MGQYLAKCMHKHGTLTLHVSRLMLSRQAWSYLLQRPNILYFIDIYLLNTRLQPASSTALIAHISLTMRMVQERHSDVRIVSKRP